MLAVVLAGASSSSSSSRSPPFKLVSPPKQKDLHLSFFLFSFLFLFSYLSSFFSCSGARDEEGRGEGRIKQSKPKQHTIVEEELGSETIEAQNIHVHRRDHVIGTSASEI